MLRCGSRRFRFRMLRNGALLPTAIPKSESEYGMRRATEVLQQTFRYRNEAGVMPATV